MPPASDRRQTSSAGRPLIYVASPLTVLPPGGKQAIEDASRHVVAAVHQATRDVIEPWPVDVHVPAAASAPWQDKTATPAAVFANNSELVLGRADALIVIALYGGSLGSGQELEWALTRNLPILVLHPATDSPSRQVTGSPGRVTVGAFSSAEDLERAVSEFVARWRTSIVHGPARREAMVRRWADAWLALKSAWESRPESGDENADPQREDDRWIEWVLSSKVFLAAAPLDRIVVVAESLGVDIAMLLRRGPNPGME